MTNRPLRHDQIWFCEKDKYGATKKNDRNCQSSYTHSRHLVSHLLKKASPDTSVSKTGYSSKTLALFLRKSKRTLSSFLFLLSFEKTSLYKNSGIDKHTYIMYNIGVNVGGILWQI